MLESFIELENYCPHWSYGTANLCSVQHLSLKTMCWGWFSLSNDLCFQVNCSSCWCFLSVLGLVVWDGGGFVCFVLFSQLFLLFPRNYLLKECDLSFWSAFSRHKFTWVVGFFILSLFQYITHRRTPPRVCSISIYFC